MAATIAYSIIRGETWTSGFRELLVPIVDGHPGVPVTLGTDTELNTNGWCAGPAEFIDNDLMVQVCASPDEPGGNDAFWIRRLATSGAPSDAVPLRATRGEAHYQLVIAVDRPRRAVVSWDPVLHRLARVSIDDGTLVEQEVAASMLPEPAPGFDRGYFGADPGLVLSPDGKRLFALGFALGPSDSGTPTGIWVFDAESLNLLDRWPPRAMLTSLAVSDDGRFLYAAGANGFDVAGNQADWASSVTVYDAQTGEIEVVYGQVSGDSWVSFRPLP
jgi:hypothetical protein